MAAATVQNLPSKRKIDGPPIETSESERVVISLLSDSESDRETQPLSRPPKRLRSSTPVKNDRVVRLPSRDERSTINPNPNRALPQSRVSSVTNGSTPPKGAQLGVVDRSNQQSNKNTKYLELTLDMKSKVSPSTPFSIASSQRKPSNSLSSNLVRSDPKVQSVASHSSTYSQSLRRRDEATISEKSQPPSGFTLSLPQRSGSQRQSQLATSPPRSQPTVEVIVEQFRGGLPQFSKSKSQAEKTKLWERIKRSTDLAHRDPDLVERYFGQTGFSKAFSVEDEDETKLMRKAASHKKKIVDRASIDLEMDSLTRSVEGVSISNNKLVKPSHTARKILTARFDEQVNPPLTFTNDVDQKRLHGKFQFVDRYILGEKVNAASQSTNWGCGCIDCSLPSCKCFTKKIEGTSQRAQIRTYVRRADGIVALSDDYIARELDPTVSHYEITECNDLCRCGANCLNRVVSKGRTLPLEIFQTLKCGWGVRSTQDIVKGQFIEKYLGEAVTETELRRREDAEHDEDPAYVFSLDWFGKNSTNLHVDGTYFGSAMRFVNHSCNPNARTFAVLIHKEDRKLFYVAFFAIRDIPKGTEIRIDYHNEGEGETDEPSQADITALGATTQQTDDLQKCYCGEPNCRGIIWTAGVKARRRRRKAD